MAEIKAGIIGSAGYTGGELLRLLINHPHVSISFAHSRSNAGKPVSSVHTDLAGETDLLFTDTIHPGAGVIFLCLGHGESRAFLEANPLPEPVKVIDLANDFRLQDSARNGKRHFIYGLPEVNREAIRKAVSVANPGCFATCIQLGLLPLAQENMLEEIYTTGITGSTGAGMSPSATTHFSWRSNNIQAYKTLNHQHLGEIGETLTGLQNGHAVQLHFVPWRGDFTRGIFASSTLNNDLSLPELYTIYETYYKDHPFVVVSREPIHLKQVVNTNKAVIQLEKAGSKLVVHSAIDNLLKGASGQAVQNMNLLYGLDETTGLRLKASAF